MDTPNPAHAIHGKSIDLASEHDRVWFEQNPDRLHRLTAHVPDANPCSARLAGYHGKEVTRPADGRKRDFRYRNSDLRKATRNAINISPVAVRRMASRVKICDGMVHGK